MGRWKDWEGEKIPKYIVDGKYVKSLARFRSGNEFKHSYFWRDEADKMCRICKDGEEDARHVFEMCKLNKNKIKWELVLKEDGSGIGYIKGIEWLRKRVGNEWMYEWILNFLSII